MVLSTTKEGGRARRFAHARAIATMALALVAVPLPAASAQAAVPPGYVYEQAYFTSPDGTELHADVWRPRDRPRAPVLLRVTPYGSHGLPVFGERKGPARDDVGPGMVAEFVKPFDHGWAVVTVDLRGTGGSEGCLDYGGPGDQADVKTAVEWAADQSWSNGRVGMTGLSYDGWTGIMALATQPRGLVAVWATAPVVTQYDSAYDNGVMTYAAPVFPPIFTAINYLPPSPYDDVKYLENQADEVGRPCTDQIAPSLDPDRNSEFWRLRDLRDRAAQSDIPVLADQGLLDFQVTPEEILGVWPRLEGVHLQIDQRAHELALEPERFSARVQRFLAEHLDGTKPTVKDPQTVVQEAPTLRWREEGKWPPADAVPAAFAVRPGEYLDARGNFSGDNTHTRATRAVPASAPARVLSGRGTWTFTPRLQREAHVSGFGTVDVTADGPREARMVALLYDVSPDGSALLITRGASLVRDGNIEIKLAPQDWRVAAGHRLGLLLTGSDDSWYAPAPTTGLPVTVQSGTLSVPLLSRPRTDFVEGERGMRFDELKKPIHIDEKTIEEGTVED